MACYPCTHCNKCGMFSAKAEIVCAECGAPFPIGTARCTQCGSRKSRARRIDDAATAAAAAGSVAAAAAAGAASADATTANVEKL